jgi:two-component system, chemotaxis family, chemotaxis protein CheY
MAFTGGENMVLVVEDDGDLRSALCESLKLDGTLVARAADGHEALDQLRAGLRPAAILVDVLMPGMTGIEFRKQQVLEIASIAKIPVVVLSGDTRRATELPGLNAAAVLKKPVYLDLLLDTLRPLLPP